MNFKTAILGTGLVLVVAGSAHSAAALFSPPVPMTNLDTYACSAVNIGTKDLESVTVSSYYSGAVGLTTTCAPLAVGDECTVAGTAGTTAPRHCGVTGGSKKSLRGALCNTTTGSCLPVQ